MSHSTLRFARAAVAATAATVLVLGAVAAQASANMSLEVPASAPLVQKLYVALPVTVVCDPDTPSWVFYPSGITITQVVRGKEIAHGSKGFPQLTCDGSPRSYEIDIFPDAGTVYGPPSGPFKKGDAVIRADLVNVFSFDQRVTLGPQTIRLT